MPVQETRPNSVDRRTIKEVAEGVVLPRIDRRPTETASKDRLSHMSYGSKTNTTVHTSSMIASAAAWEESPLAYPGVEFKWPNLGLSATPLGSAIENLVNTLKANQVRPRDINGVVFRTMPIAEVRTLAKSWNVISAHIFGRLYDEKYTGFKSDYSKIITNLEPGVVITTPITERLMDDSVSIDHLERSHGLHGASITKFHTSLISQEDPGRLKIEVRPCYGLHGEPPQGGDKAKYARLVHIQNDAADVDENGIKMIHYSGNHCFTKPSYFCVGEPIWISVKNTPCAWEGSVIVDEFQRLTELAGFKEGHPFVSQGERLSIAREVEAAEAFGGF